ncbi:transposase [Burkholderia vietnamiensis]|uniref:transposase n=1 Tax=Burkholderia vietnamiensis TaxID=60552 RepID=UPI001E5D1ABC|nr:transposase [Burkholderia vietnamiensis]
MSTKRMVDAKVDNAPQSKRPNFSVEFKRQIVEATLKPGASAALIADHPVNRVDELLPWNVGTMNVSNNPAIGS